MKNYTSTIWLPCKSIWSNKFNASNEPMAGLLGAHVQLLGMKFKIRNTEVTSRMYNTLAIKKQRDDGTSRQRTTTKEATPISGSSSNMNASRITQTSAHISQLHSTSKVSNKKLLIH